MHLPISCFGPLDVLVSIGRSRGYDDLLPHIVETEGGTGLRLLVLNLETLIAVKKEVGGAKDAATLPILAHFAADAGRSGAPVSTPYPHSAQGVSRKP
jgi:hypothetical protein